MESQSQENSNILVARIQLDGLPQKLNGVLCWCFVTLMIGWWPVPGKTLGSGFPLQSLLKTLLSLFIIFFPILKVPILLHSQSLGIRFCRNLETSCKSFPPCRCQMELLEACPCDNRPRCSFPRWPYFWFGLGILSSQDKPFHLLWVFQNLLVLASEVFNTGKQIVHDCFEFFV